MGIFSKFFKQKEAKKLPPIDFSLVAVDVHSHLIPGIDDGAQTMEDSITLITQLQELGYKKLITTPHIYIDYYKNTPEIIQNGLKDLKQELVKQGISIQIEAAAEYFLDQYFLDLLEKDPLLTFGENYLLFEQPFLAETPYLSEAIFQIQLKGLKPVLAHVERYNFWHGNYDKFHEWKEKGVLFQLNINSLSGAYGPTTKLAAEYMINHNLYDFLGSDCHNERHIDIMKESATQASIHKLVQSGTLLNAKL